MKTSDLVQDYLRAVEREASALPAERRQELLADLAEHIEVTRAERPDTAVVVVLAELGDPGRSLRRHWPSPPTGTPGSRHAATATTPRPPGPAGSTPWSRS